MSNLLSNHTRCSPSLRLIGIAAAVVLAAILTESTDSTGGINSLRTALPVSPDRQWATPIKRTGLPNLHKVSDQLYRGAQPTAEGMRQLKAMGVRTVVNLRTMHSDRDEIGETGLAYEHIYFNPLNADEKEVVRFLQIATDPKRQPVFVHCWHGVDRTGTMSAAYRIAVQGWSKDEALREMTEHFEMHEGIYPNLLEFIQKLDVEDIRRRAGIDAP